MAHYCVLFVSSFFSVPQAIYRALHTLAPCVGILRNLRFPQKPKRKSRWHITWGIVIVVARRDGVCGLVSQDLVIYRPIPDASYCVVVVLCPRVLVSRLRLCPVEYSYE